MAQLIIRLLRYHFTVDHLTFQVKFAVIQLTFHVDQHIIRVDELTFHVDQHIIRVDELTFHVEQSHVFAVSSI